MSKTRLDGFYLFLLGGAIFVLLSLSLERGSSFAMQDFKAVYYAARCLVLHQDPYQQGNVLAVYQADGGVFSGTPAQAASIRRAIALCTNLPSTLILISPLTLLPFAVAEFVWMVLIAASMLFAAFLMWSIAAERAPRISGGLIFLLLANSELLLIVGNAAGVVVSLSVIAAWCFLQERFEIAGIVCIAISLVIKPHDAGLVWLFFLLEGGARRKHALRALLLAAAIAVVAFVWVQHVVPYWMQELHSNLAIEMVRGGQNDPGPASAGGHGLGSIVSLQAFFSTIRDDPHFYNPAAELTAGALVLLLLWRTLRSRPSSTQTWFGLAAVSALTMLPVYHRSYDARMLLLTVPACAILWTKGGAMRWLALLLNVAGILWTGDIFWALFLGLLGALHLSPGGLPGHIAILAQVFLPPLGLLAVGCFYLWVYIRSFPKQERLPAPTR